MCELSQCFKKKMFILFYFIFDIGVGVVYIGECMFVYVLEGNGGGWVE